ncbi:MAG: cell division protein FtsH [Candidatus Entotheonella factor]|uniref:ATP-dependent zinc metalloprotease FtsH n=1 Tax=Entotheonella factor TaxID=1429438 RepID=W4LLE1_ENTF1|nr:ATP-dependent zinc metalloprotease FtsH [Candidatus Entotheonella palauensis]ETW98729.1 MAG: cell division protein FtsH [Candidatus Entotheonella factor]
MPVETNGDRDNKMMQPSRLGSGIGSLILFLLILNFLVLPSMDRPSQVLYSEFLQQVRAGQVEQASVSPTEIRYSLKSDASEDISSSRMSRASNVYTTVPVESDLDLVALLEAQGVKFGAPPPSRGGFLVNLLGWVIPPLIFLGLWMWLMRRMQGGPGAALTVGKSKARIYSEGDTGITFEDVAGAEEAKAELQEIVQFLKNSERYTQLGAVIPKGVLLVGPPGTGKTLFAKAVAGEANVPFFSISGSEFIELFVGVGAARVRDLFQQAKQKAPCIVFIDELDAIGKTRGGTGPVQGGNDEREQTLNQLLTEMDGFEANAGVVILSATNRPEVLDPALRRPGRFDRQVVIDRPDKMGREAILRVHVKKVKLADDVDFGAMAGFTSGFSGADLANLVNEAALLAARREQNEVSMAEFNEAFERVVAGLERKTRVLNPEEKQIVAYHEVGHALVGALMPGSHRVEKISIVPRGVGALGYTLQLPEEDRYLMAEDEIRGRIATLLGGRSAEEVVFDKVSTGASDDIQKATDMAERMVTLYGMDDKLGPVAYERTQQQFLDGMSSARRAVGAQVASQIDEEVLNTIESAHQAAIQVLETNRALLEDTAQHLLRQEVLEGETLAGYLTQARMPAGIDVWLKTGAFDPALT